MSTKQPKRKSRPAVPKFATQPTPTQNQEETVEDKELMDDILKQITSSQDQPTQEKKEKEQKEQQEKQNKMKKVNMMDKISSMFKKKVQKTDESPNTSTNNTSNLSQDSKTQAQKPVLSVNKDYGKSFIHADLEEYDPIKPNDYEQFKLQQKTKKRGQKSLAGDYLEKKRKQDSEQSKNQIQTTKLSQQEQQEAEQKKKEELQQQYDKKMFSLPDKDISKVQDESVVTTEEKALKMMKKLGYKVGEGLGKNKQGRTSAIIHMKVGDNVGVLTQGQGDISSILSQDILLKDYIEKVGLKPSRILVLLNMVSPGDIDDDLEDEVVEECELYGKVLKSIVFMQPNAIEEEAVRIFVMFESTDSAIQAFGDLHRRTFDGRVVTAVFYDEQQFIKNQFDNPIQMPSEEEVIKQYQEQQQQHQSQMEIEQEIDSQNQNYF